VADWDDDSPQLNKNLIDVRASLERDAKKRSAPTVALAKSWHTTIMAGLTVPDPVYVERDAGRLAADGSSLPRHGARCHGAADVSET
jgi:hypothetical protein